MKSLSLFAIALCGLLTSGSFSVAQTPPFASTYSWTSTGPLISAKNGYIAVKDPSAVLYNGRWVIYASTVNSAGSYGMEYLSVAEDWSDAATATPTYLKLGGTAPQVFYFAPQKKWYLISEWGTSYSTNSDPTQPLNWSAQTDFNIQMPSGVSGIDPWIICDSTDCYLFQCADNGNFYRSSTPIGNFPNGFSAAEVVASDSEFALFEADNVYTVEGGGYLANIEALGSTGRYFRALWANSLGGTWYDLGDTASFSTPFLGINNTTFESGVSAWTTSFSSGGMLIDGNDQTDSINTNNLAFLYQGASQQAYQNDPYGSIPWQLGVAYSKANTTGTPSFTLSRSASSLSLTQGSNATDTVSVTQENGFTGSVTFTASGLPSGVTASFSPTSSTSSSVLTLTASSTATTGSSTVTITGTSGVDGELQRQLHTHRDRSLHLSERRLNLDGGIRCNGNYHEHGGRPWTAAYQRRIVELDRPQRVHLHRATNQQHSAERGRQQLCGHLYEYQFVQEHTGVRNHSKWIDGGLLAESIGLFADRQAGRERQRHDHGGGYGRIHRQRCLYRNWNAQRRDGSLQPNLFCNLQRADADGQQHGHYRRVHHHRNRNLGQYHGNHLLHAERQHRRRLCMHRRLHNQPAKLQ